MDRLFCTDPGSRPSGAGTGLVRQVHSTDLEEHTQQLLNWQLEYDQLDCGRFEGRFTDIRLPGLQLFMESTSRSLRQRGVLSAGCIGMAVMLDGQGELVINGVNPGREGLAAVHDGAFEMSTPAGCLLAGVVVEELVLQQACQELLGHRFEMRRGVVTGLAAETHQVEALVAGMRAGLQRGFARDAALDMPGAWLGLRDDLLLRLVDVLAEARDVDADGRAAQRKWLVDRACELMMSRPDDPPPLDEVCRQVGASLRKLNYCFQEVVGLAPNRYIRALRLNAARRELRRGAGPRRSVSEVAVQWGFSHFGRFSGEYKRQFCESPSEGLRRGRRGLEQGLAA